MVKYKSLIFTSVILFFLLFSFYPTIFEIKNAKIPPLHNREFILEHNYYWPDYNLYLSKIRQGWEGKWLAKEKYTSESHTGSLIQIFYVILGQLGRLLNLEPNNIYLLARIILSPLLLMVIILFVKVYFKSFIWQIISLLIILTSGSIPRFTINNQGALQIGRFMEWWSNIDALQRITFIPHILFGQLISFYLLYQITILKQETTLKKLVFYVILGNLTGLVFPPSLITLIGTISLLIVIQVIKQRRLIIENCNLKILFILFSLPSILYILILTKQLPWSTLVNFHKTHPMMIPFDQYILGTGPVFFISIVASLVAIIRRYKQYLPLILWLEVTFIFASLFSIVKDQSPLRFTQTGLFIPLGLLASYFFHELWLIFPKFKTLLFAIIVFYLTENLFIMTTSFTWQKSFINQRLNADIPPVPYPPQTMYPLKEWLQAIGYLRETTTHDDIVLAYITAGSYIPAYSGNTVYFGQANTVNYDEKQLLVESFYKGNLSSIDAENFLRKNRIKYIFESYQERDLSNGVAVNSNYPYLRIIYTNPVATLYSY